MDKDSRKHHQPAEKKSIYDVPMDLPGENLSPLPGEKRPREGLTREAKTAIGIVCAIILVALLFGGWKLLGANKKTTSNQLAKVNQSTAKTSDVPDETATQTYTSNDLGLTFRYPVGWTVAEANSGLRVVSPNLEYQTTNKGVVDGNFRVYMRETARQVDDMYIGRGYAIGPSVSLTYTNPQPGQLATTWLTNYGLDKTNNFAFFLIAGNFDLTTGQTLGPNYGTESGTYIIAGGYTTNQLTDDLETNMVPTSSFSQTNAYKEAVDIVKSIQIQATQD